MIMTLGEKIRDARKRLGQSQSDFCKLMEVTRQAVAKWEGDIGIPDLPNLRMLSIMFNMTLDEFLDESGAYAPLHITKKLDEKKYGNRREVLKDFFSKGWEYYALSRFPYLDFLNGDVSYFMVCKEDIKIMVNVVGWTLDIFELPRDLKISKFEFLGIKFRTKKKLNFDIYVK